MVRKLAGEFLRHDWRKLLLLIILVLLTFVPSKTVYVTSTPYFGTAHGFPFIFYANLNGTLRFDIFHLALDLVILYLFSCAAFFYYDRYRAGKK